MGRSTAKTLALSTTENRESDGTASELVTDGETVMARPKTRPEGVGNIVTVNKRPA
jgi:hypothetical protein